MKRLLVAGLALALLVPACALAQSAFNGTWKTQLSSVKGMGSLTIHLKNGMYSCSCSVPPVTVNADGNYHAVSDHPGYDAEAVTVVNDHTLHLMQKKDGKVVYDQTVTVAPSGKTATFEFTDSSGTSPVTGKGVVDRVGKAAHGSNAAVGSWKFGHWESLSDNARTFTYKVEGKQVSYSDPTGYAYSAEIGGKAVPYTGGGMSGMTVSVARTGKRGLRETYMHDGKVTRTSSMTVSADGKTMKAVDRNRQNGMGSTVIADKQ
jgi:hypothetical protein